MSNFMYFMYSMPLYFKYCDIFSIVNSGLSIDRDTKMAVSLSPTWDVV